ncbi:hypothetical protein GWI33_018498 [Rhynchophorus ferrugineus]|uniref:LEM domain-containing protein n=1 Tax=Rhynchophorus ferrugineus TaxID=354439 RepID=A0A834I046_RHYFE|nr:hypothetical protein GWI33_018498 [Rhynchophorus ferrugineus]
MLYRGRDKREFYLASLLYDSIEFKHLESVTSLLVEKGADPNLVLASKGICPFHLVVGGDSNEFSHKVTSLILQNGGNPNVRSDEGLTPVHIAAAWGKTNILKLLLRNGGDPLSRDINGKTPRHYASAEGFTDCLDLLDSYFPDTVLQTHQESLQDTSSDVNNLVFDKIIVNNGFTVGEYVIDNQAVSATSGGEDGRLHSLPNTDATEYILNWFNQQQSIINSTPTDSLTKQFGSTTSLESADSSPGESDGDRTSKRYDSHYITFRKVYRKTRKKSSIKSPNKTQKSVYFDATKTSLEDTNCEEAENFSLAKEYSTESGIITLPVSVEDIGLSSNIEHIPLKKKETSSDYQTCSQISIDAFEKNVFEITEDLSQLHIQKGDNTVCTDDMSFVSVSEVYKYEDKDEGIVLYEKRLLKSPSECARSVKSSTISSRRSTLPESLDYDTDTLRRELTQRGFPAGPITVTTKKVYLKKLYQLKKSPVLVNNAKDLPNKRVYSVELEKTLRDTSWTTDLTTYKQLEADLIKQFSNPDPSRKWREADNLSPQKIWETFLSGIFYVGKGKRSRPYQHLYDAVELWKDKKPTTSKKLKRIMDIWKNDGGVICLHVYLNIIPVEAYTREAAMISALTLDNITNVKGGEFYGIAATWPQKKKKMLGVYLLHKAMMIFLQEGERQLFPADFS